MGLKRGFVFTADVMMGISLFIIIFFTVAFYEFESILPEKRYERLTYIAEDTMDLLAYMKARDIQDKPTVNRLIAEGVLTEKDLDKSVLDLIASFWYADNKSIARNISEEFLGPITKDVCINLTVDGEVMYNSPCPTAAREVAVSTRIESGYEPGMPTFGYIARAFLTAIKGKRDSSYAYFGGFVGQGNITRNITLPPFNNILEAYMEMGVDNNFTLFINGNYSGFYMNGSAGGGFMKADKWVVCNTTYLTHICLNFTEGENTLQFNFTGNNSYIGGGYFRVTYNTTQFAPEEEVGVKRYWFPGIHGFINLYSSFYVPGILTDISAYLHYYNNISGVKFPVFLSIGNVTVFEKNVTTEQKVSISDVDISGNFTGKDKVVKAVSNKTVPIRMGIKSKEIFAAVGVADAVLITDVSGSMGGCDVSSPSGPCDCNAPPPCDRTRINVAKDVDEIFVDTVLDTPGNRVGLVAYTSVDGIPNRAIRWWHDLTEDTTSLKTQIGLYSPQDCTCISCGINVSTEILIGNSTPDRFRGMLVMSDGQANTCIAGNPWKGGTGCGCGAAGKTEAINEACKARDNNITVFAVAFGNAADKTTLKKIACWNCSVGDWIGEITLPNGSTADCRAVMYAESNNVEELKKIYKSFGEWFGIMGYTSQLVNITGEVTFNNTLYPDSYIELNYTPITKFEYGEISLTREADRLRKFTGEDLITEDVTGTKEGWYNISEKIRVIDAKITSYSSEYWTDRLLINSSNTPNKDWKEVYNLSYYRTEYSDLGDPYIVQIPVNYIGPKNNSVRIGTGFSTANATGGSPDDRVIYTMAFEASVGYGKPNETAEGAEDDAFWRLVDKLLYLKDLDVTLEDVQVNTENIRGIRWLWGPSLLKAVVWEKH